MDGTKIRYHLISTDLEGTEKEKGTFRFWSGYVSYDYKPFMRIVGNHLTTPKPGKNQWIAVSESVTQEERGELEEQGEEPLSFGFASINEYVNEDNEVKHSAKIIQSEIMDLRLIMSGWINRKEIDGKEVDTLTLAFNENDFEYWKDKAGKDETGEIVTPYILSNTETPLEDWLACLEELKEDFKDFDGFLKKYFPSSKGNPSKTAMKRRDLLARLKAKSGKETKAKLFT